MAKIEYLGSRFYFNVDDFEITGNTDPYIVSFFKQGGKKVSHNDQRYVCSISRTGKDFKRYKYHGFANITNAKKELTDFIKSQFQTV